MRSYIQMSHLTVTLWTYIRGLRAAQPHYCLTLIKAAELNPPGRSKKQTYASTSGWKKRVGGNECARGAAPQRKHWRRRAAFRGIAAGVQPDYLSPKTLWVSHFGEISQPIILVPTAPVQPAAVYRCSEKSPTCSAETRTLSIPSQTPASDWPLLLPRGSDADLKTRAG